MALNAPLYFKEKKKFSFQKTPFKVTWKDFDIIMHITNGVTNRFFDWD